MFSIGFEKIALSRSTVRSATRKLVDRLDKLEGVSTKPKIKDFLSENLANMYSDRYKVVEGVKGVSTPLYVQPGKQFAVDLYKLLNKKRKLLKAKGE